MLEEKEVPYRVELINMRSYGDKPASYMRKVQGGILPALELDGAMYTESLDIMAMIDAEFAPSAGHRAMLPPRDSLEFQKVRQLLQMERSLFRSWCDYVFRGGFGLFITQRTAILARAVWRPVSRLCDDGSAFDGKPSVVRARLNPSE